VKTLRQSADGCLLLSLHVQPGAKRTEFAGVYGDALKIRLAAPPVDGKANTCLLAFLADFMKLPKRAVTLVNGDASRSKLVRIEGASAEAQQRLCQIAASSLEPS